MRFKLSAVLLTLVAALALVAAPAPRGSARQQQQPQPQQDDQGVIEGFVTTRGAGFGERPKKPAKPVAPPKKATTSSTGNKPNTGGNSSTAAAKGKNNAAPNKGNAATKTTAATNASDPAPKSDAGPGGANTKTTPHHAADQPADQPADEPDEADVQPASASAVGLGYTILKVGEDGSNTVVDPSRPFAAGDRIRVALETNAEGFLYIFNVENDTGDPLMLYPHPAVDRGTNRIAAHARDFFPTDLRYSFVFDETAATEHLYIIFSRRPLAGVPSGSALLEYCGATAPDDCFWKPAPEQWARIKAAAASGRVVESKNRDLAAAQTTLPPATLSRGIKVKKNEPAPAVVRMNASAESDVLLTKIMLVHK